MPYRDREAQLAAKAASARRKRAERRGTTVEPVAPDAVTNADLLAAGRILGHMRGDGEPDDAYRDRLRTAWASLLRVVE